MREEERDQKLEPQRATNKPSEDAPRQRQLEWPRYDDDDNPQICRGMD